MKLVVVDDSELIQNQLLRLIATRPAIEVVGTATSEADAVTLILDRQPDAVILDLALSPGSGMQVLKRIRAAGCQARVLVLTNNTGDAFRAACEAQGVAGFYDKYLEVRPCLEQLFSWLPDVTATPAGEPAKGIDPADYRSLFDAYPDALFVVGDKGRILHVNAAAMKRHGQSRESFIAMNFSDLASPSLGDEMVAGVLNSLGHGEPFEWRHRYQDGSEFPVRIYATAIRFEGEAAILACVRDISKHKFVQACLDEQGHLLARILDAEPSTVYVYDLDTHSNVFINRHWLAAFGYTPEETASMGPEVVAALFHPDDLARIAAHHEAMRYVADGEVREIEYRCRNKAGEWRSLKSRDTAFARDRDSRVSRILGIADDVTEQRRTEERLRQLSRAFDQCIESIVVTGLDARIQYVNDAFVRISGYSREELIGQNPRILSCGKTPRDRYAALWEALTNGHSWRGEFHNRRKDGSEYIESVSISPVRAPDGQITHYVAVKDDITELKRITLELETHREQLETLVRQRTSELVAAREAAEAANRAKSAFLAAMSHEIRTPLNAVIGLTHLVRRAGVSPRQMEQLGRVDSAGQHLLALIDGILDLSKIEAGALQLEHVDFSLRALVDNVSSMIGRTAQEKGVRLKVELDPNLPDGLCGDPTRLRQALLNLAANAVKFTEDGSVTIAARRIGHAGEMTHLRFDVIDTGPGLEADALHHLFQPFAQADRSTTRKYGGSGLGLVITRRLAQRMGGDAGAESTPGCGSRFWFSAWLAQSQTPRHRAGNDDAHSRAEDSLRARFGGRRMLVVDDEPVNREVAVALLEDSGLEVDAAADGEEAIDLARHHDYAAILMDIQMQPIDGLATTQQIRKLPGHVRTPVVAITANAFVEDRERCLDAGMDAFIAKPFRPELLYGTLLRVLDAASASDLA
jgi:two-component system sensor histidine kinase/response regulator